MGNMNNGGSDGKESACNAEDPQREETLFNPSVRKTPWRREWLHSSILPWRIPWTEEPGGLQSMG